MTVSEPKKQNGRKLPWMLRVTIGGKLTRKFYGTYQEAILERENLLESAEKVGASNLLIDPKEMADYRSASSLLPDGFTLTEAIIDWLKQGGSTVSSGVTLKVALEKYWKHKEDMDLAGSTYSAFKPAKARVLELFGDRMSSDNLSEELEQWFKDLLQQGLAWHTVKRHKVFLEGFYGWAIKKKLSPDNWIRFVEFAKEPKLAKRFLTVEETQKLLSVCEAHDKGLINVLVLGLFAGIRPEEIQDGQTGNALLPWDNIDFKAKSISVQDAKQSGGKVHTSRYVEQLPDTVFIWLKKYESHKLNLRNFRKRIRLVMELAGIEKKLSSLFRKSFATHAVPVLGSAKVAVQMGHSAPATTEKSYKGLVQVAKAEEYFALRPKKK